MINLLKSDFYKLLRSKSFYICTILLSVFSIINLSIINLTFNVLSNIEYESAEIQESVQSTFGSKLSTVDQLPIFLSSIDVILFLAICISIFCCQDFVTGTIKNIASKGFKREYIYLSKFILSIFISFTLLSVCILTFIVGSSVLWGFGDIPSNFCLNLLKMLGLEFLVYIAITSLFTMVSYLIRQTGTTIGINICSTSFSGLILMLLSAIITKVLKSDFLINNYWILNYPQMLASYDIGNDVVLRCSLVSVITIILTSLIGIFTFKKREIK